MAQLRRLRPEELNHRLQQQRVQAALLGRCTLNLELQLQAADSNHRPTPTKLVPAKLMPAPSASDVANLMFRQQPREIELPAAGGWFSQPVLGKGECNPGLTCSPPRSPPRTRTKKNQTPERKRPERRTDQSTAGMAASAAAFSSVVIAANPTAAKPVGGKAAAASGKAGSGTEKSGWFGAPQKQGAAADNGVIQQRYRRVCEECAVRELHKSLPLHEWLA